MLEQLSNSVPTSQRKNTVIPPFPMIFKVLPVVLSIWIHLPLLLRPVASFCSPQYPRYHRPPSSIGISAQDLLYQDQQEANARRAAVEENLLGANIPNLEAPQIKAAKVASGSGFSAGSGSGTGTGNKKKNGNNDKKRSSGGGGGINIVSPLAVEQAKIVARDGVLRIDRALSPTLADALREHVLKQQRLANEATTENADLSRAYYGVENRRKNRCDLLLSLAADENDNNDDEQGGSSKNSKNNKYIIPQVLNELLGQSGTLRPIYEQLVTSEGEFYEFAAVITDPGSDRQQVHPDLPFRREAPLYVIFLALQDVTERMGPTTFLLGTHTEEERIKFDDLLQRDQQLANSSVNNNSRLALLNKGDAVLFDARVLHCGNANHYQDEESNSSGGTTRAMLNFSFRNPKEKGNLGYCGSMRPGYVGTMTLGDVSDALLEYEENGGVVDPFARYGNGLFGNAVSSTAGI